MKTADRRKLDEIVAKHTFSDVLRALAANAERLASWFGDGKPDRNYMRIARALRRQATGFEEAGLEDFG